jgi:ABC-2 type transport system permease protein
VTARQAPVRELAPLPSSSLRRLLRILGAQAVAELRVFLRNPPSVFFTLALPWVYEVIILGVFRNARPVEGVSAVGYYAPAMALVGIVSATYTNLAMTLAIRKDGGLTRLVVLMPVPAWIYLGGIFCSAVLVSILVVAGTVAIASIGFGFSLAHFAVGRLVGVWILAVWCFGSLGIFLAGLIPNAQAASAIVNLVILPLFALSGSFFAIPDSALATAMGYLPLRPTLMQLIVAFNGGAGTLGTHTAHDLVVIAAWGVAATLLAIRFFRFSQQS